MVQRVYKSGPWGMWKAEDEKHSATHVLVELSTYGRDMMEVITAKEKVQKAREDAEKWASEQVARVKEAARMEIQEIEERARRESEKTRTLMETAQKKMAEAEKLQSELSTIINEKERSKEKAEKEAERLRKINENFLRQARERANAMRGITPKKKRSGYRLLNISTISQEVGRDQNNVPIRAEVCVTELETPYGFGENGYYDINLMKKEILNEMKEKVFPQLGIKHFVYNGAPDYVWEGKYQDVMEEFRRQPTLFRCQFDINFRVRPYMWKARLTTTAPVILKGELQ